MAQQNIKQVAAIAGSVVAVGFLVWSVVGVFAAGEPVDRVFFTTDDGKSWFEGDATNIAPFEHNGQQAVRAYVYTCGTGEFVGYIERHTPQGREVAVELQRAKRGEITRAESKLLSENASADTEIKRPGESQWISTWDHSRANTVMDVRCEDGKAARLIF